IKGKVAFQDPCHLNHAQKIRNAPRELLKFVGATLVELPHPEQCCGSAGTYNVTQNGLSMQILERKLDDVEAAGKFDVLASANVGCILQLRAGLEQRGDRVPVKHVVEVLEECY
ncbi:MAG TPA: heterodisulfide reductase-related iron-sulfur binding cluster, partial [Terriglobales bacterium]|nr:heterodisulfide reductase-related iron-sulfur binding cluster [Terriglobales bacterium]